MRPSTTACIASIWPIRSDAFTACSALPTRRSWSVLPSVAAHELAVVAHRAAQPGALDEEADEEQEHQRGQHAEGERQVIEQPRG